MNLIENSDLNLRLDDITEFHFLCVNCGNCRDWYFTGDRETWNWVRNYENWNDADWKRHRNDIFLSTKMLFFVLYH